VKRWDFVVYGSDEVGVLSAAFGVAVELDMLASKPVFKQLAEGDKRSGFFEPGDFAALVGQLPTDVAALVRFLRLTGWRRGEGTGLLWAQIDWDDPAFPGAHETQYRDRTLLFASERVRRKAVTIENFPSAKRRNSVTYFSSSFGYGTGSTFFTETAGRLAISGRCGRKACKSAGVPGKLVHDLRRTAARDFRRAGVSEGEIMRLAGWKTRDMFDRYNINDSADLSRAVALRFNGKVTARRGRSTGSHLAKLSKIKVAPVAQVDRAAVS
jgi:integrase